MCRLMCLDRKCSRVVVLISSIVTFAWYRFPLRQIQLSKKPQFLLATYAVVANHSAIPVSSSSYRLVSGQIASGKTVPPPRDRQPLGGKNGISYSTLLLLTNVERIAFAVTCIALIGRLQKVHTKVQRMVPRASYT